MKKSSIVIVSLILILGIINYGIYQKEIIIKKGKSVYLKLLPVDPRSLMQGDYMRLRFEVVSDIKDALKKSKKTTKEGLAIIELSKEDIGNFKAIYQNQPLKSSEILIKFRVMHGKRGIKKVKLSTDSYFFSEGKAKQYAKAEYGVFKVAKNGDMILINLADENRSIIR